MDQKILKENYKEHIKNLKEISLNEYLKIGFDLDQDSILKAIKYFKICMPKEIKEIILKQSYWDLYYNDPMKNFLIETLNLTEEESKKAISTFVYTFQGDKRDFEILEDATKLKEELLKKGFKEQEVLNKEELKLLDNKKVLCVFDRDRIGLMGSFTSKEEKEGTLKFLEDRDILAFLPKRHTKTGQLLYKKFYYKFI